MSANNITNITGDGLRETTIASSSNKDLVSSGVKTSDSMEPRPSSSSSSAVQRTQDTMQVRTGVQTRSTRRTHTNYETASAEVESFKRLHKIIYGIINAWSKITTNKNSEFYVIWETKWKDKITAKQTFSGIKTRLNIQSIENYFDHIILCPDIQRTLDIHYDTVTAKIKYRKIAPPSLEEFPLKETLLDEIAPLPNLSEVDITPTALIPNSVVVDFDDPSYPTLSHSTAKPKGSITIVSPFNDILDPSDTQDAIQEYIRLTYPSETPLPEFDPTKWLETTIDNHSFPLLHRMIYELIQFWANTEAAKYYPFYEIWKNWDGVISSTSHFRAIQHWMQINTLQDYMNAVLHCPYIADNFVMDWNANTQSIKWRAKHLPTQTAFDPPKFNRNVVNKVDSSTSPEAQPFLTTDAFRALLTDIQDEQESEGTTQPIVFFTMYKTKLMVLWDTGAIK
jgi:hypothetical protein